MGMCKLCGKLTVQSDVCRECIDVLRKKSLTELEYFQLRVAITSGTANLELLRNAFGIEYSDIMEEAKNFRKGLKILQKYCLVSDLQVCTAQLELVAGYEKFKQLPTKEETEQLKKLGFRSTKKYIWFNPTLMNYSEQWQWQTTSFEFVHDARLGQTVRFTATNPTEKVKSFYMFHGDFKKLGEPSKLTITVG